MRRLPIIRRPVSWIFLLLSAIAICFALPAAFRFQVAPVVQAAGFSVTNTNDDGPGSLRSAIVASNLNTEPGNNVINFNLPGSGIQTINLLSPLPIITTPVTIDGGSASFALHLIELNGSSAGAGADGLTIAAGHCTVQGLVINRFRGAGVRLQGNGGNTISGNFIGTDGSGGSARANGVGIQIDHGSDSNKLQNNLISGNSSDGVRISSNGNTVLGNIIGFDAFKLAPPNTPPANGADGIVITSGSNNTIGSVLSLSLGNHISLNGGNAIQLRGAGSQGNKIQGNTLAFNSANGVLLSDSASNNVIGNSNGIHSNSLSGVRVANASANTIQGNLITENSAAGVKAESGLANQVLGNTILQNFTAGVRVDDGAAGTAILQNYLEDNRGLGIDLGSAGVTLNEVGDADTGANNLQNFPVLTAARVERLFGGDGGTVEGTLNSTPNTAFQLQFFNTVGDSSGYGEGGGFLGSASVTTDAGGNAAFTTPITSHSGTIASITATATDPGGNTSEFSRWIAAVYADSLAFDTTAFSAKEGNSVTITVSRPGNTQGTVAVNYATSDGTASAGQDYTPSSGTLTFANGEHSKSFNLRTLDDQVAEGVETVILTLSSPTNGAVLMPGLERSRLVILDDESPPPPTIVALRSGASGSSSLVFFDSELPEHPLYALSLSGLQVGEVLTAIAFRPRTGQLYGLGNSNRLYTIETHLGAAHLGDCTPVGTAPFSPLLGNGPFGFRFNPITDRVRVTDGSSQNLVLDPDTGQVVSQGGALSFASSDPNNGEPALLALANSSNFTGATATTTFGVNFKGDPAVDPPTLVTLGSPGGFPVSPDSGQLFTVGQVVQPGSQLGGFDLTEDGIGFIVVTPVGQRLSYLRKLTQSSSPDSLLEWQFSDSQPIRSLAVMPRQRAQFTAAHYSVNENAGAATVSVKRNGDPTGTISVNYATSDGTATAGVDYSATSGVLTFADGETSKSFVVPLIDDVAIEGVESINLTLSIGANGLLSGAVVGPQSTAEIAIMDEASEPGTNPIDNADFFVRQHYADFLNRGPDEGGLAFWTNHITQCLSDAACINQRRVGTSAAYFIENEFQQTGFFIHRFYEAVLGRRPSFAEFTVDRGKVVGGANLENGKRAFGAEFVQRTDFLQQYPANLSAEAFVEALITTAGQASGVADLVTRRESLIGQYNQGTNQIDSRVRAVRVLIDDSAFSASQYNSAFVLMQYFGYLQRGPDQAGYDFWLDHVNNRNPNNYRSMVCAFITSAEYQHRFSPIITRSDHDCSP